MDGPPEGGEGQARDRSRGRRPRPQRGGRARRPAQPDHLAAHGRRDARRDRARAGHRRGPDRALATRRSSRPCRTSSPTPRTSSARSWEAISSSYAALVKGAVGSASAIGTTVERAAPLICAGLGVSLAFRAGPVQHRCPGPADHRRPAAPATSASRWDLPSGLHLLRRLRRRPARRRDLGRHRRRPQGADRRPRGHHHDHAQLPGRVGAALRPVARRASSGPTATTALSPPVDESARFADVVRQHALRRASWRSSRPSPCGGCSSAARSASSSGRSASTPTPRGPRA